MKYNADSSASHLGKCQIHDIPNISVFPGGIERILLFAKRIRRFAKRRYRYLLNMFSGLQLGNKALEEINTTVLPAVPLQAGDLVRVKSREEIQRSLNDWNQTQKCSFMEEMWQYCGTTQQIFKRVEKFIDERDYIMKKCNGIYLLDGVFCNGTVDFGRCDRSCLLFWREEWLERIGCAAN